MPIPKDLTTAPATTTTLLLEEKQNLVLAAGIQMGKPGPGDTIQETQYCGTGKILTVG